MTLEISHTLKARLLGGHPGVEIETDRGRAYIKYDQIRFNPATGEFEFYLENERMFFYRPDNLFPGQIITITGTEGRMELRLSSTMNTCKTCKNWTPYAVEHPTGWHIDQELRAGGYCKTEKITEDWDGAYQPDRLVYSYMENGSFWTGPDFGCIHHSIRSTVSALDPDPH